MLQGAGLRLAREDRHAGDDLVEVVARPDHRVPEAVGGHGELHRHERVAGPRKEAQVGHRPARGRVGLEDVVHHRRARDAGQEVLDHHPLVVPRDQPPRLLEQRRTGHPRVRLDPIDHPVVELDHRQVQLGDDDVLVVARVADQRPSLLVSGQILPLEHLVVGIELRVASGQQLHPTELRIQPLVEVGGVGGPAAVERVQVEARRAEVDQPVRIADALQGRDRIEGDVVVDELAQVGVAHRDRRVVGLGRRAALLGHGLAQRDERLIGRAGDRQVGEHPAEAALEERGPRHRREPTLRRAAVVGHALLDETLVGKIVRGVGHGAPRARGQLERLYAGSPDGVNARPGRRPAR